ncbi:MAG: hypothetical protein ACFFD4_22885 [Candidatus Odinarchaeota archaeon]
MIRKLDLRDKVNCCFYSTDPAVKAALLREIDSLPDVACLDPEGEQEFSCAECDLMDECKRYLKARLELPE